VFRFTVVAVPQRFHTGHKTTRGVLPLSMYKPLLASVRSGSGANWRSSGIGVAGRLS
jgi:hypothetical protein